MKAQIHTLVLEKSRAKRYRAFVDHKGQRGPLIGIARYGRIDKTSFAYRDVLEAHLRDLGYTEFEYVEAPISAA